MPGEIMSKHSGNLTVNEDDFTPEDIWEGWIDRTQDEIPAVSQLIQAKLEELKELCF